MKGSGISKAEGFLPFCASVSIGLDTEAHLQCLEAVSGGGNLGAKQGEQGNKIRESKSYYLACNLHLMMAMNMEDFLYNHEIV